MCETDFPPQITQAGRGEGFSGSFRELLSHHVFERESDSLGKTGSKISFHHFKPVVSRDCVRYEKWTGLISNPIIITATNEIECYDSLTMDVLPGAFTFGMKKYNCPKDELIACTFWQWMLR